MTTCPPSLGPLSLAGHIDLPAHAGSGGFDHAAPHAASGHVFVAHTANGTVDVFDPVERKYLYSIEGLPGVAGVLVSDEAQLVLASSRAENTLGVFAPRPGAQVFKISVGLRPNGLAYDHGRRLALVANVGDPEIAGSYTLTLVDLAVGVARAEIEVAGRTRWALFDPDLHAFYVNIAQPSQIVVIEAEQPDRIARVIPLPAAGAHGLDLDRATHRLFCACDAGRLVTVDAWSGQILDDQPLSGVPDVVFFDGRRNRLYVAVGDPGVIDVFDTTTMRYLGLVATERGAHTFALTPNGDRLCAFLPATHRAAMFQVEIA
jgi:DNA-binding beta-propeller fold protein YncE